MGDVLDPLQRDSTPDRIAVRLRSGIFTGQVRTGQALRAVEVASQVSVSKSPVSEACLRLMQESLLKARSARDVVL